MKKQAQCQTPKRTFCLIHKGPALVLFVTVFVAMTICCVSLTLRAFVFLCSTVSRKRQVRKTQPLWRRLKGKGETR